MAGHRSKALVPVDPDYLARLEEMASRKERALERLRVAHERLEQDRANARNPFTKERRRLFLDGLAAGLAVRAACRAAHVSAATVYTYRQQHEDFARQWAAAMDAGCEPMEERIAEIAMDGDESSMATVRAAELWLRGRSHRYSNGSQARTATATLKQSSEGGGQLAIHLGGSNPFPD